MITLFFLGREVMMYIGATNFIGLYLAAGVVSVFGHLAWSYLSNEPSLLVQRQAVTGGSGSIMAVAVLYAGLFPNNMILLYGIIPIKAWMAVAGFIAFDLISLNLVNNKTSNAGHLAGALYGFGYLAKLRGL